MSENITGSLQENLLTLLVFDEVSAPLIINTIEPGLFESDFYKEIVKVAMEYYKHYKTPPKEHIADLLETKIQDSKNPKTGELYKKLLTNLFESKDSVNSAFVIDKLNQFVRRQRLKGAIIEAALLIKDETDESLIIAENTLNKTLKNQIQVFDRGLSFSDPKAILRALNKTHEQAFPFGVKHVDELNIGPARGELLIFLASVGRGKSWSMVNIAKHCIHDRLKTLYITLEMPEEQVTQRLLQSIFSMTKSSKELETIQFNTFAHDELNRLSGVSVNEITRASIKNAVSQKRILKTLESYKNRFPMEVKRFPTGSLSVEGLEVYLDSLDRLYNYVPDVILLDYADLMKLDYKNLRTSTGEIYKELRRIAIERNVAMVTASQANRTAEDARVITLKHLAEDYSKAATADTVLAYCQTSAEKQLKLARLFIAKARNEEGGQTILISQAYGVGQFCMESTFINDRYWNIIDQQTGNTSASDEAPVDPPRPRPNLRRRNS